MARIEAGLILSGKYRLEHPIGRGGMGWVWRAQHVQWGAPVAVKLIDARQLEPSAATPSADSPVLQRFFGEARAAATIRSPHVVQILDHGVDASLQLPFIVMELLEGETLEQRLAREGRLHPVLTAAILGQVARALTRVHEAGMVHRDLKPSNVFLVSNEEDVVAKVLDFGIAKASNANGGSPITATGQQMGTPYYMSPEQIRGRRDIDFKADLWALGVIAFECLTGTRPFRGETLGDLSLKICVEKLPTPSQFGQVPDGFDAWFQRALRRDRDQTFASAREAAETLRAALTTHTTSWNSSATRAADTPKRQATSAQLLGTTSIAVSSSELLPAKKRRAAAWLAAVAASAAIGAGTYAAYRHSALTGAARTEYPAASVPVLAPNTVVEPIGVGPKPPVPHESPPQPQISVGDDSVGTSPRTAHAPEAEAVVKPRPAPRAPAPPQAPPAPTDKAQPAEISPRTGHDLIENRL